VRRSRLHVTRHDRTGIQPKKTMRRNPFIDVELSQAIIVTIHQDSLIREKLTSDKSEIAFPVLYVIAKAQKSRDFLPDCELAGVLLSNVLGCWVDVNSEARALPVSKRLTTAELIDHGIARSYQVLIAGPDFEASVAAGASPEAQHLVSSGTNQVVMLSLPYVATAKADKATFRIVKFDKSKGGWVDVGSQNVNLSKHLLTARVSAVGKFTVVEEIRPTHR
jgi:hypothetical protein